MTVTTPVAQAEAYARRAASEGRYADAAASFAEASANQRATDPASVGNAAADAAQAALYAGGSHLANYIRVFGAFAAVGLFSNAIEPVQFCAAYVNLGGTGSFVSLT